MSPLEWLLNKRNLKKMKTLLTVLLLSLLAVAVSSCGRGYGMHHSGPYGNAQVYERTFYPAVHVGASYPLYPRVYAEGYATHHYGGGMGGWMH